ncbi:MAG: type 4a pilus biogenesis protein PilO [Proteobacteria bacterium]|nr:type 4a pilus biogenesis protein PilO [Pseudomonadota bacterium]
MGDLLERIGKLTAAQKLAAAIGIYVAIAAGLFFLLIKPTSENIDTALVKQEELTEQRDENRDIAENRDRWERRVERLNEELLKAVKELPNDREIPELVRRISSIGKKIGLEFLLFQPLPEARKDFYADVPVKLKVEGSYHEVATFFDRIGKLNRIVNIRNIAMSDPSERSGKIILTIEGTAVTYRFLTEAEVSSTSSGRRRR